MFAYIGGSSPVFIEGLPPVRRAVFALMFGLCSVGFIAASQVNARILLRFVQFRAIGDGTARVAGAARGAAASSPSAALQHLALVMAPIFVAMSCMGFVMPNTTVGALSRHAAHAASASALMGTCSSAWAPSAAWPSGC